MRLCIHVPVHPCALAPMRPLLVHFPAQAAVTSCKPQPLRRPPPAPMHMRTCVDGVDPASVCGCSGHGTQVPSDDPEESDSKDEAICPCDMNLIEVGIARGQCGGRAGGWADRRVGRQAGGQTGRWTCRRVGRQAGGQTGGWADRQDAGSVHDVQHAQDGIAYSRSTPCVKTHCEGQSNSRAAATSCTKDAPRPQVAGCCHPHAATLSTHLADCYHPHAATLSTHLAGCSHPQSAMVPMHTSPLLGDRLLAPMMLLGPGLGQRVASPITC
eukprot:365411-Chlamydomonas_euryale.AAC.4